MEKNNLVEKRVTLIAEIGVNHNGSVDRAEEMIRVAAKAGVDVVKFQTFQAEAVISRFAEKAAYQKQTTGEQQSQLEMVRPYQLDFAAHSRLFAVAAECGVEFLSTPFDLASVDLLLSLGVSRFKIPSGEITNAPLLFKIAQTGSPIMMSTGMSTLDEIRQALGILALGASREPLPDLEKAKKAYESPEGKAYLQKKITLLHCTTQYPTPPEDVNLLCMDSIKAHFHLPVGYSDHTVGVDAALAAVARGAVLIEKHFTLNKSLPGPDHLASADPMELQNLVVAVRKIERLLGSGEKKASPSEVGNRAIARKSLVASRPIQKGEFFNEKNITTKRPGNGVSALYYWDYLGRKAQKAYGEDELISE